jgi:hypothetical protein
MFFSDKFCKKLVAKSSIKKDDLKYVSFTFSYITISLNPKGILSFDSFVKDSLQKHNFLFSE